MTGYGFLRWLRSGASAAITVPQSAAGPLERASFTARVDLLDDLGGTATATRDLTLFGASDVIGIDTRQVVRMAPVPGALDAEVERFAHVELDDPGLPWLMTPFREEADGEVLPWLALVVVADRPGVSLRYAPGALLPVLHVDDATKELPDLAHAAAWAHVQLTGGAPASGATLDTLLSEHPELTLSRLICPRALSAATTYLACVVPVFRAGALAGLGQPTTGVAAAELAWEASKQRPVDLPVYVSWSFTTAADAGFATLVRRLVPRSGDELPGVGERDLDLGDPGFGMTTRPGTTVPLGGALRVPERVPADAQPEVQSEIGGIVDQIHEVGPPLYGRWLAAANQVPAQTGWLRELNVEPRHRVAAGLGVQVVQAEQEELMAAAWEQLGDVLAANQLLRQAQLALAVNARIHTRHLTPVPGWARVQLAGPALARLRSADLSRTLYADVAVSCLPPIAVHATVRRLVRIRGPLARRARRSSDRPIGFDLERLFTRLIDRELPPTAPRPAGAATLINDERNAVIDGLRSPMPGQSVTRRRAIATRLRRLADRGVPPGCTPPANDVSGWALERLRPEVTLAPRVKAQVVLPSTITPISDDLAPVLAAPRLDGAMYRSLVDRGQDWLLPGLEHVPANTVTGLEPNDAFVEAFLVGLNHELGSELLWRGYPTDQRGTVSARFWDLHRGDDTLDSTLDGRGLDQILPIHRWRSDSRLTDHRPKGTPKIGLVLLLRGDLIRHFPRPHIVLVPAEWARDQAGNVIRHPDGRPLRRPLPLDSTSTKTPLFTGRLEPDVAFLGYEPTAQAVRGAETEAGAAGYFVLFAEQPTEPRFGPPPTGVVNWDDPSDSLAATLLRRPLRLFVHGSDLLPAGL